MSKWPEEVPILTEKDLWKNSLANPNGSRYCLIGWTRNVFPSHHLKVVKYIGRVIDSHSHYVSIASWNDTHTHKENAKVWNKAMAKLGYVVNNPEAGKEKT